MEYENRATNVISLLKYKFIGTYFKTLNEQNDATHYDNPLST